MGLLFGTIVPAHADPVANLTYAQFIETAGYKELQAASATSATYLSNQSGLEVESTTNMSLGDSSATAISRIEATKTALRLTVTTDGTTVTYLVVNGKAYLPMDSYLGTLAGDYPGDLLTRIPGGDTKVVQMTKIPAELDGSLPEKIFSPTQDAALSQTIEQYGNLLDLFKFSEVTKIVSADDPTFIDYNFDMILTVLGSSAIVHETATFKNGFMTGARITTGTADTQVSQTDVVYTIKNDLVIDAPEANTLITEASVKKVMVQAQVAGALQAQSTAIIKKATALAKKAKAQLSSTHLTSAATSLKTKYTKITNGIKISVTIAKVKGNLCITAVKGKTSTKTC